MKRPLLLLSITVFFIFSGLRAATVSTANAQNIAINFFKITFPNQVGHSNINAVLKYTQTEPDGTPDFYVFNISPITGFVVVAAQDQVIPVLAYSSEAYFNSDFAKTGVANWINKTAGQIHGTVAQQIQADGRIQNLWSSYAQGVNPGAEKSTSLGPMCATTWSQEPYYNEFCPINPNDGQYCVTGCVATAMAQIMKYWNYPPQGTGSFSYDDDVANGYQNNIGVLSANFGSTTYQWTQMPNYLTGNNTAIGTLMSQCGISVAMDYSDGGSGAWVLQAEANQSYGYSGAPCAQNSYATYFFYNPNTLQGVYQGNYTTTQWINLLENEMNNGRVVQYEGADPSAGGHTWVCDGYDVNNNLHMNWGWGGPYNGFYAVTNLSAGGYVFYYDDAALIGIEPLHIAPDTGCVASAAFTYQNTGGSTLQFTNTSTSTHSYFTSSWTFYNGQGQFTTSTATNPLITFTGPAPYSATLHIADTAGHGCSDSINQPVNFNPNTVCISLQYGNTKCSGAEIASYPADASSNYSFASGYNECFAEQWTVNGTPNEGRGLLLWDFSQIPAGSVIVSADLNLYVDSLHGNGGGTYGSNDASYLYQITAPWNPNTVTWNNQPAITTTGGVLLPQSDSVNQNYTNLDVTNFVQGWISNPSTNYGMMLKMITQSYYNSLVFCSSAYGDTVKWPSLEVCFIPPNPCQAHASFVQQNLGAGQVQFTSTSTDTRAFTYNWTFYNGAGSFATSNIASPVITFTGQPPFSAQLIIIDSICSDTASQLADLNNCVSLQYGNTKCSGAQIASYPADASSNYSFASGYNECFAEQWTVNGTPNEGRGLLLWDFSQIPTGSVIISADLNLYVDSLHGNGGGTYGSNDASYLYQITTSWDPNTVTWNTQPSTSTNNAVLLPQSDSVNENYLNLDVSGFVQNWVNNPSSNYGMMLQMITQNKYNSLVFCSSAYADTIKWPKLDICYQIASSCHLASSFNQQGLGNSQVQFTNTSTTNSGTIINWTFYNANGVISTSTQPNPLVTFTGQPTYRATLLITDTITGCQDSIQQVIKITTGIFEPGNAASDLSVYPNPNNGNSFNVVWPAGYDPQTSQVRIYDMLGRNVQYADITRHPDFCNLAMSEGTSSGIYTVIVGDDTQQQCGKLVIVK